MRSSFGFRLQTSLSEQVNVHGIIVGLICTTLYDGTWAWLLYRSDIFFAAMRYTTAAEAVLAVYPVINIPLSLLLAVFATATFF
jgi:uncharacterized protein YgfB (UPF0149 family)